MRGHRQNRHKSGQSLIEVVIGAIILIVIALFFLDLIVLVSANSTNDGLVKSAARAAANRSTQTDAATAVSNVQTKFKTSGIIPSVTLALVQYNSDQVQVQSTMQVKLPIAFPGMDPSPIFKTTATEPNVSVQPGS